MSTTKIPKVIQLFPQFPVFKRVSLADRKAYEELYKQFEPYSDFSFNNLWIWFNHADGLAFSVYNGNLIIRLDDPFNGGMSEYTILGKTQCTRTFRRVLRWQKAMGLEQKLVMVPEEVIHHIQDRIPSFKITEDHDNHDYIYDVETAYRSEGHQYAGYRRALSLFKRLYEPDIVCKDINLQETWQRVDLINHVHRWDSTYRQDMQAYIEGTALNIYLQASQELSVRCFGVFVKDELVSFVLYHLAPQGGYGMLNHIKCNYEYKHISDFTMHAFIEKLHELHLQFENFEQDLGLMGLRHYKQSLRPYKQLKRYTITPL